MASITEILESNGIEINDELKGKLAGLVEESDEVKGLVKTKNELLEEKVQDRLKRESMEGDISRLTISMQEYKAKAEQASTVEEELQALRDMNKAESERAQLLADKNQQLNGKRASERKNSIVSELSGKFRNPLMASGALNGMVDVSFDEDGNLTESFKDSQGNLLDVTDSKSFFDALSKIDSFASEIKAPASSGSNPLGGSGSHSASSNQPNQAAEAAKKSGDQVGHLSALFAQNLNKANA
ncbi:putative coil containing protein [Vibrio phage 381E49-1]|nr:putative coil containing protein [Vibrio phage 381E49-1]